MSGADEKIWFALATNQIARFDSPRPYVEQKNSKDNIIYQLEVGRVTKKD